MKHIILLGSPIEIGLRISIIMDAYNPRFLSPNELLFLDYILIHCSEFYNDFVSDYPSNNFRTSDITERKANLRKALLIYMQKGIIIAKLTPNGTVYRTGGKYPAFIKSLDNEFVNQLLRIAQKIFLEEQGKTLNDLYIMWRDSVNKTRNAIGIPLLEEVIYE